MKPFKSFLAQHLEDYVAYRGTLGYTDKNIRSLLKQFDQYVAEKEVSQLLTLNPVFFLEMKKKLKGTPSTVNGILSAIRGFFNYMVRIEICERNPLQDIPLYKANVYIPFIFSADEIDQMLSAVQNRLRKTRVHFLEDLSVYMVILLLARCGLRISEPLRLRLENYQSQEGTIYIEKTKFNKDRLIPVPKSVVNEIKNYLAVRNSFIDKDYNTYLFTGQNGKRLSNNRVYPIFHQAVQDIGIKQPRRIIANTIFGAPRPHSFRHSFAINTLKRIKSHGKSTQNALPILSAYLGHSKYRYTAVYLKCSDAEHRQGLVDFAIAMQEEI
jgi:integrase/recombinase XerD